MADEVEEKAIPAPTSRGLHIKKRALKNKALSISFDENDLRNYVTGFQKRKKKRRKVALKQQEEVQRRKRIEARKKRKLEKEFALYGGAPPATDSAPGGSEESNEEDEDSEPVVSVSGTTTYDSGELKVTVTTSEISHEDEIFPSKKIERPITEPVASHQKHKVPVTKKKTFKRVARHKSRSKSQNKRDKAKGNKKRKSKKGR